MQRAMAWAMCWLGLSCRSYAVLASRRRDRPLTLGERIRFRMHGLICGLCRRLPRQLQAMRDLVECSDAEGALGADAPLDDAARTRIRARLEDVRGAPPSGSGPLPAKGDSLP